MPPSARRRRVALVMAGAGRARAQAPSAAFDAFVDGFLEHCRARHPSIAAGNGLHAHDGSLEDFSAAAIGRGDRRLARRCKRGSPPFRWPRSHPISRSITASSLACSTRGCSICEGNQNWRKNPMIYAAAISDGVHNLMTMESAPAEVRARRVVEQARGRPGAPGGRAGEYRQSAAGDGRARPADVSRCVGMLGDDLAKAFARSADPKLKADLSAVRCGGRDSHRRVRGVVREGAAAEGERIVCRRPRQPRGTVSRRGADRSAGGDAAGDRRARAGEERGGVRRCGRAGGQVAGCAGGVGDVLNDHPKQGQVVAAGQKAVDELQAFVAAKQLVRIPPGERVNVARGARVRSRAGVDARLAAARDDAGDELLLHHRRAGRTGRRIGRTSG